MSDTARGPVETGLWADSLSGTQNPIDEGPVAFSQSLREKGRALGNKARRPAVSNNLILRVTGGEFPAPLVPRQA